MATFSTYLMRALFCSWVLVNTKDPNQSITVNWYIVKIGNYSFATHTALEISEIRWVGIVAFLGTCEQKRMWF